MEPSERNFHLATELHREFDWRGPVHAMPGAFEEGLAALDAEFAFIDDIEDAYFPLGNVELPIFNYRHRIKELARDNRITIIVAETGAGKTTQIPQYLLQDGYEEVIVTQPRRVAAYNAYLQILKEVGELWGPDLAETLVSCQTGGGLVGPEKARIKVVTDGLYLNREFYNQGANKRSAVMLDEMHEWNENQEYIAAFAKANPNVRIIVTSATMEAEPLAKWFSNVSGEVPPILRVKGRTFDKEHSEEPLATAAGKAVENVLTELLPDEDGNLPDLDSDEPKGTLVFAPGKKQIKELSSKIRSRLTKKQLEKVVIFPLHAQLPRDVQQEAIDDHPGKIKVVVATEMAQTSLTIAGIKYVVDPGLARRIEVDDEGTQGLMMTPISRAEHDQRGGRVGRVSKGFATLTRLDKHTPYVAYDDREAYPAATITRSEIASNMLRLKALRKTDIRDFDTFHDIPPHMISLAERNLRILGAIDQFCEITPIGQDMAHFPTRTSSARIMVESARLSESTRGHLAALVAVKEAGGLIARNQSTSSTSERWKELTDETSSDLMLQLDLFIAAQTMDFNTMIKYGLDIDNFRRAYEQYVKIANIAGAPDTLLLSPSDRTREDILNCMYVGFLTSIYSHEGDGNYVHAFNKDWPTVRELSNSSVLSEKTPPLVVADPYRIGGFGGEEDKHILQNVSVVTTAILGSVATSSTEWTSEGYVMSRDGKYKETRRQTLFGMDLGMIEERPAEPSPALRHEIIDHALMHAGSALKELRKIKSTLEQLAHQARGDVPRLTVERIIELVEEAASEDITSPSEIEDNLRMMMYDRSRKLHLDDFVTPEQRAYIRENAPPTITVDGVNIDIRYVDSKAIARRYNNADILKLQEEVYLEDGRRVMFSYPHTGRKYTLMELQARIRREMGL